MLLRFLKANHVINLLLIPVLSIALWMNSLLDPQDFQLLQGEETMPFFRFVTGWLADFRLASVIAGMLIVNINAFLIVRLSATFHFLRSRSVLPGVVYMLSVSTFNQLHTLQPVHLATLFFLLAIFYIFNTYHRNDVTAYIFNASLLISIATLFYFPVIISFPLLWISVFILQKADSWRTIVIPLLGFAVPWIYALSAAYFFDQFPGYWQRIGHVLTIKNNAFLTERSFQIAAMTSFIVALLGSSSIVGRYDEKKISSRKYFSLFYWMVGLFVLAIVFIPTVGIEIVALMAIPLSYFVAHYFLFARNKILPEIILWIYLLTLILCIYLL